MNILIINFEYPPLGGGGGVATRHIAEELSHRHRVHVLTTGYGDLAAQETVAGVHIHRVRVWGRKSLPTASISSLLTFVPAALVAGWRICRQIKFDIINAQFVIPSGIVGAFLSRLFHIPFVVSFIGGDIYDPSKGISPHRHPALLFLIRVVASFADAATAISEDTKRRAQQIHGVTLPISVLHLGLVPLSIAPVSRSSFGLPDQASIFITIGRLIPRKGYAQLLHAWQNIPQAHLIIIGSGPLEKTLQQLVVELDLTDRVHLYGQVSEEHKHQLLLLADGYVSAAEHEGFGIVFLEAMGAGLPIVTFNNGGHTDFLTPNENALLVPVGQMDQLIAACQRLVHEPALRLRVGRQNKEKAKDFYIEKTVKRFENLLIKVKNHESSN